MGYESWPHRFLSPSSIELDPDNPRLPGLPHNASQSEVFKEMFEAGKARDMIRSVAKSGYFPDQRVVVIRKDGAKGKFIVVEGNRRVCACKALNKPSLAPEKHSRFVEKWALLAEPVKESFSRIPAVIAPSRAAAMQLIVSRHLNQAPVKPWSRFAQGKFAINAMSAGEDLDFVEQETGLSVTQLKKAIQEARLFDLFLGLDWSDEERERLLDNVDNFPIEALSRVLKSSETRDRFGDVDFSGDGMPSFKWEPVKAEILLKRLVYDAVPKLGGDKNEPVKLNSRTTNGKAEIGKYLDDLPEEVKPEKVNNYVSGEDFISVKIEDPVEEKKKDPVKKVRKQRRVKRNQPALPADIECGIQNDKARALLDELQSILPEQAPIGTALLLRSLLEISLIARMKKVGTWGDCMAKHAPSGKRGFIPGLEKIIKFAVNSEKTIPDEGLRRAVGEARTVPKDFLNLVAHNDQHILVPTDVRDIIARLTPLMRELLK